ncbi:MAG: hypothetical protein WBL50_16250 [Candidatus Acidiferrum sp.]
MNTLTDLERFVATQLFAGENSLVICRKICESGNGVPGNDSEARYTAMIADLRKRIKDFEAEVFDLAVLGFQNGFEWREVYDTIHSSGLIRSSALIPRMCAARDHVFPPVVEEPKIDANAEVFKRMGQAAIQAATQMGDPILAKMIAENERVKREHAEHRAAAESEAAKY